MVQPWSAKAIAGAGVRSNAGEICGRQAAREARLRCKRSRSFLQGGSLEVKSKDDSLFDGAGETFFHPPLGTLWECQLDRTQTSFRS
jgi:hypothetical protein